MIVGKGVASKHLTFGSAIVSLVKSELYNKIQRI